MEPKSTESDFSTAYSSDSFVSKCVEYAKDAGEDVIRSGLTLYYAGIDPETPAWAKNIAYGALGYFIFPIDAIPDAIPIVGYTDDLGVLAAAIGAIASCINNDIREKSKKKFFDWFGK